MVYSWCYFILPVLLFVGLLRKCLERTWGRCKSTCNLQGRVFLVTGANSGIGKETVRELAKRNATIIMACRDLQNARDTIAEIRNQTVFGELIPMKLDLASFASIRIFAEEVLRNFPEIHVLINNAGVYVPLKERALTQDGIEIHFGVNHLGHFLLTNLLLDRLKNSAPSRVVIVTSKLLESGNIDFSSLARERGLPVKGRMNPAYCNSKLANVYFGGLLAGIVKDTGLNIYMACPGFTYTRLFRNVKRSWFHYIIFSPVAVLFLRTANQGAQTVLHCATDPDLEHETGNIYSNCKQYDQKKELYLSTALQLWYVSDKLSHMEKTVKYLEDKLSKSEMFSQLSDLLYDKGM